MPRGGAPAPGAPARAADARPLPGRPPGGGARGLSHRRALLVEELGIEPGSPLQELERAILRHDPSSGPEGPAPSAAATGAIPTARSCRRPRRRRPGAASRARRGARARSRPRGGDGGTVPTAAGSGAATAALARRGACRPGAPCAVGLLPSLPPGAELARLASEQRGGPPPRQRPGGLLEDARILTLLAEAPLRRRDRRGGHAAAVPGPRPVHRGRARLERGRARRLARAGPRSPLRAGRGRPPARGATPAASWRARRSLSRGRSAWRRSRCSSSRRPTPWWPPRRARRVVVGLTDRWRRDGLGAPGTALATRAAPPALLVRRGLRPGGLAPRREQTRFTWTIAG